MLRTGDTLTEEHTSRDLLEKEEFAAKVAEAADAALAYEERAKRIAEIEKKQKELLTQIQERGTNGHDDALETSRSDVSQTGRRITTIFMGQLRVRKSITFRFGGRGNLAHHKTEILLCCGP